MVLNEVIWHNGNAYKILKKIKQHSVSPKNILNKEILAEWRDYVGANHVLQQHDEFWLCETIQDAIVIEDEIQTLVEESGVSREENA
jgi:streptomycin 6-kinase